MAHSGLSPNSQSEDVSSYPTPSRYPSAIPDILLVNLTNLLRTASISDELLRAILQSEVQLRTQQQSLSARASSVNELEGNGGSSRGATVANVLLGFGALSLTLVYAYLCTHVYSWHSSSERDKRRAALRVSVLSFVYAAIFCSLANVVQKSGRALVFVGILHSVAAVASPAVAYGVLRFWGIKFRCGWQTTVQILRYDFHLGCIVMESTLFAVSLKLYQVTHFPLLLGLGFFATYSVLLTVTMASRRLLPNNLAPSLQVATAAYSAVTWYLAYRSDHHDYVLSFVCQVAALTTMSLSLPLSFLRLNLGDTLERAITILAAWYERGVIPDSLRSDWAHLLPYWLVHMSLMAYSLWTSSSIGIFVASSGLLFSIYLSSKDTYLSVTLYALTGLYILITTSPLNPPLLDTKLLAVLDCFGLGRVAYAHIMYVLDIYVGMVSQGCTLASIVGGWHLCKRGGLPQCIVLAALYWFWSLASYELTKDELLFGSGGASLLASFILLVTTCALASFTLLALLLLAVLPRDHTWAPEDSVLVHTYKVIKAEAEDAEERYKRARLHLVPGAPPLPALPPRPFRLVTPLHVVYFCVSWIVVRYLLIVHTGMVAMLITCLFSALFSWAMMVVINKSGAVLLATLCILYQGIYVYDSHALTLLGCVQAYSLLCNFVWRSTEKTQYRVTAMTLVLTVAAIGTIYFGLQVDLDKLAAASKSGVAPASRGKFWEERLLDVIMKTSIPSLSGSGFF